MLSHLANELTRCVSFYVNKQQELIKLRELSRFQEEHGQSFGRRERHDSTDSIEDSMEIKRLRSEISNLQAECQHWKSIANGLVSRKPSTVAHTQKVVCLVHLGHLMDKLVLQNCLMSFDSFCPVVSHCHYSCSTVVFSCTTFFQPKSVTCLSQWALWYWVKLMLHLLGIKCQALKKKKKKWIAVSKFLVGIY